MSGIIGSYCGLSLHCPIKTQKRSQNDHDGQSGQDNQVNDWENLVRHFRQKAREMGKEVPLELFTPTGMAYLPPPELWGAEGDIDARGNVYGHQRSSSSTSAISRHNHFGRIAGDIPIEKFPYGKPEADWPEWCRRFELAVQTATNARDRARLNELCLLWISLKLPDEAQPLFSQCQHKASWPQLKAELELALEDVHVKRKWARSLAAFEKPSYMRLQIYKAKVIGLVAKHSPVLVADSTAYTAELYNRFVHGLDAECRSYIEDSIPYGKETIDKAYNQALKYEAKMAQNKVEITAAAMTDGERRVMKGMRSELREVKAELAQVQRSRSPDSSSSSSSESDGSIRGQPDRFRALQSGKGTSESEVHQALVNNIAESVAKAVGESLKGLKLDSKKKSKPSTHSKRH